MSRKLRVENPVDVFARELGVATLTTRQHGWSRRVFHAAHAWTKDESAFVIAFVDVFCTAIIAVLLTAVIAAIGFVTVVTFIFIAAIAVACVSVATFLETPACRRYFYSYLVGSFLLGIVGSYFQHPVKSFFSFLLLFSIYFVQGIRGASQAQKALQGKSSEEQIEGVFRRFREKHQKPLLDDESTLNQQLRTLTGRIEELKTLQSLLEGELRVAQATGQGRDAIQKDLNRLRDCLTSLLEKKEKLEQGKRNLLSAIQSLEALQGEATTHVRRRNLAQKVEMALDGASALAEEADVELERIRRRLVQDLHRFYEIVRTLELNALPSDADLPALEAAAIKIDDRAQVREAKINARLLH